MAHGALLLVLLAAATRSGGGPRSLAEQTGGAPKGTRLSLDDLRALCAAVGFPDARLAAAIAMAESNGYTAIRGDSGHSVGLFQINLPSHPEYQGPELEDPATNARAALAISQGGRDWSIGWHTTWTRKRYVPFL